MQLLVGRRPLPGRARFNPHPPRRTGATNDGKRGLAVVAVFQCSPVPKDGCNLRRSVKKPAPTQVSILTRPEGRVQLWMPSASGWLFFVFQSSPVPKDGCNGASWIVYSSFGGFNPHPSRRTGATNSLMSYATKPALFQSSPVPEDGCNSSSPEANLGSVPVSILTRPGGRVQRTSCSGRCSCASFQSSPVPEDGCNRNPTSYGLLRLMFQSSPVPEDGCNRAYHEALQVAQGVSILTRPGGRVQLQQLLCLCLSHCFNPHPSRRTGATG